MTEFFGEFEHLASTSNLLGAAQWQWILRTAGVKSGFVTTLRIYCGGLFLTRRQGVAIS